MPKYRTINNKEEVKYLTKEEIVKSDEFFPYNPIHGMVMRDTIFGDSNKYPVINSLNNIFNDLDDNEKSFKYCTTLIRDYRECIRKLNNLDDKKFGRFMLNILRKHYVSNLGESTMSEDIVSHMKNLIDSVYKNEIVKEKKR